MPNLGFASLRPARLAGYRLAVCLMRSSIQFCVLLLHTVGTILSNFTRWIGGRYFPDKFVFLVLLRSSSTAGALPSAHLVTSPRAYANAAKVVLLDF